MDNLGDNSGDIFKKQFNGQFWLQFQGQFQGQFQYIPGADPMPVRCNGLISVSVKMGERTGSVNSGLPVIIPLCLKCWPPRIGEALPKTARISAICKPKM